MTEPTMDDVIDAANAIEAVCVGRSTAAVYTAISMVLGTAAAAAPRPDFDGMMRLVEQTARHAFDRQRGH